MFIKKCPNCGYSGFSGKCYNCKYEAKNGHE